MFSIFSLVSLLFSFSLFIQSNRIHLRFVECEGKSDFFPYPHPLQSIHFFSCSRLLLLLLYSHSTILNLYIYNTYPILVERNIFIRQLFYFQLNKIINTFVLVFVQLLYRRIISSETKCIRSMSVSRIIENVRFM